MRVWHDAPDEVRVRGVEGGQEGVQLRLEVGGHSLVGLLALLLPLLLGGVLRLPGVVAEQVHNLRIDINSMVYLKKN